MHQQEVLEKNFKNQLREEAKKRKTIVEELRKAERKIDDLGKLITVYKIKLKSKNLLFVKGERQADQSPKYLLSGPDLAPSQALWAVHQSEHDQPQPFWPGECRHQAWQEAQGRDVRWYIQFRAELILPFFMPIKIIEYESPKHIFIKRILKLKEIVLF